ncbi:MAG: DUF559 domain-containing protein [Chroococcidiopsidaceae cyanobacterium CP_BM_RX_35]|nr:DUF559 domain-containing protein [Chroococcidiopsidaceae cyanobacterium CP_BM_RX_35]
MSNAYLTDNERVLGNALTLAGIQYLQKHCLHGYYPNFIFPGHKLVVVIERKSPSAFSHNGTEQKVSDQEQDLHLSQLGYQTVRYSNQAIKNCTKGVVLSIQRYLLAS